MMGSVALGQAGPQLAVLGGAQGSAASIFEVLDRVSYSSLTSLDSELGLSTLLTSLSKMRDNIHDLIPFRNLPSIRQLTQE